MQIVGRGLDGHMPHVEGQFRQAGLDIGPFLIPADERLNSEAVPEIMNARPSASFILDASVFKKLIEFGVYFQARSAILADRICQPVQGKNKALGALA